MLILFICSLYLRDNTDSFYKKIVEELENNQSIDEDDLAIKWALAKLGDRIGHTITSKQIEEELTIKINHIIEQVEIVDSLLEHEFIQMKNHFVKTKESLFNMVETTKSEILNEMKHFINEFNYSILNTIESSKPIHESYVNNSQTNIGEVYGSIMILFQNVSILFFFCFHIFLILNIVNYLIVTRI